MDEQDTTKRDVLEVVREAHPHGGIDEEGLYASSR